MKRFIQLVLLVATACLAVEPILAEIPIAASCAQSMPDCTPESACCHGATATPEPTHHQPAATTPPASQSPCQHATCFSPSPQTAALLLSAGASQVADTSLMSPALVQPLSAALDHQPPHPNASAPARYLLFHVFRI